MTMKKLTALALGVVMSLSLLTACAGGSATPTPAPSATPAPEASGAPAPSNEPSTPTKLIFGTSADYPPYEFHMLKDGVDTIVGLDVSIAYEIAKDMGAELEIVDMNFDNLLTMVTQGTLDFVIADTESTPDREASADGSDPYYEDLCPMVLVKADKADEYKSIEDFTGKNVGAQSGTNKAFIVTGENEEVAPLHMTGANAVLLTSVNDLVNQLVYDKLDAVVLDGSVAVKFAETNPDLVIPEGVELGSVGLPCVWVAEGDPKGLLPSINATIARLKAEGAIEQFMEEADALSSEAIG